MVTNLKIVRIKRGIPQWKLASQIGIDNTKLSLIETGRLEASDSIKKKCSRLLNLPIKELFPDKANNNG